MIWNPTQEWIEGTNVWRFMQRLGFHDREAFLRFSRENPERFWDELMREMRVEWFEPYRQGRRTPRRSSVRRGGRSTGPKWLRLFLREPEGRPELRTR